MWLARSLGLFSNIHLLASENAWAWCLFIFVLEKDILRKFVVASLSGLLPRVYPQPPRSTSNISPPPPPYLWSIVMQATTAVYEIRRHFYTFVCGPFKFLLCITASDRGEYRKSSEINNRVNTLTPKIYKFSRLIYEHFLEEIVSTIRF